MDQNSNASSNLDDIQRFIETQIHAYPEAAGVGLVIAAAALLTAVLFLLRGMWKIARAAHLAGTAADVRRGSDIGARILIARSKGRRGGAVSEFLSQTARTHVKRFMFGGPFDVIDFPSRVTNLNEARALLKLADADLVMWGEAVSGKPARAHIMRRTDPSDRHIPEHRTFELPKRKGDWSSIYSIALAYGAARALRPALGRPSDFRADRLIPVVETLERVLSKQPDMDPLLAADVLDDYSAGVLQLSLSDIEGWKERSVDILRSTLERMDRAKAPDRWITAKINLGRALKLRCERRFDPILLQEAIGHLTDALEALRMEPRFKIAENAAQAIADCQKMLGTRRRFSITKGGI